MGWGGATAKKAGETEWSRFPSPGGRQLRWEEEEEEERGEENKKEE